MRAVGPPTWGFHGLARHSGLVEAGVPPRVGAHGTSGPSRFRTLTRRQPSPFGFVVRTFSQPGLFRGAFAPRTRSASVSEPTCAPPATEASARDPAPFGVGGADRGLSPPPGTRAGGRGPPRGWAGAAPEGQEWDEGEVGAGAAGGGDAWPAEEKGVTEGGRTKEDRLGTELKRRVRTGGGGTVRKDGGDGVAREPGRGRPPLLLTGAVSPGPPRRTLSLRRRGKRRWDRWITGREKRWWGLGSLRALVVLRRAPPPRRGPTSTLAKVGRSGTRPTASDAPHPPARG